MLKAFNRLWLKGIRRIGKIQKSQTRKMVKNLLAPVVVKRPASKVLKTRIQKSKMPIARQVSSKSSTDEISRQLPGKWLSSYYDAFPDDEKLIARRMRYWLYVPNRDPAVDLPLVVMLHGCGQTATQFAQGTRMNQLAEEKGFAVLYPQQSLRGHPQRCWPWYEKKVQSGGGEVQMIAGTIDKVAHQYAIDNTRIYVAGLSAGAAMAHIMSLIYPHRIAAVGLHSGPVFGAGRTAMGAYAVMQSGSAKASHDAIGNILKTDEAFPKIPAILLHGDADKVVRPINLGQLAQQFRILNQLDSGNAAPVVNKMARRGKNPGNAYRTQDYLIDRKSFLKICEIQHLEHAWSGGDCSLPWNACNGPDASKLIWDFFARHQRPPSASL
ncbi:MAG: PHB depolymerase family esterase [Collimonas sp.]